MQFLLEGPGGLPGAKQARAIATNLPVTINGNLTVTGTLTATGPEGSGAQVITAASANALTVGPNGTTNPIFNVDTSTASAVAGINIIGAVTGGSVAINTTDSGNAKLTINAAGSGILSIGNSSTGLVTIARGALKMPILGSTLTSLATQNTTPTAAQLLGGYIEHASTTGGGTATLDTAANIIAAITFAGAGDSFSCLYANTGSQTVTITTNTGLTLHGTVAITTGKNALLNFRLLGGGNVAVYITVSA